MNDSNKDKIQKKFEESLQKLLELSAEARIDIYEQLFSIEGKFRNRVNTNAVFRDFSRKDFEISKDNIVVMRKPRVFLSHSSDDKKLARRIYKYLQKDDIQVWFDEAELRFGDSLIARLRDAIDCVDILLALISKNSINSEWVKKEIDIAINQEIHSRRIKVIPIICDSVELPGFMLGKVYADFKTKDLQNINLPQLVSDIRSHFEDEKR